MNMPLPLRVLADGTHIVDPVGWTVAKCYGDYAEEYARLIVTAVNSHAELLVAAWGVLPFLPDGDAFDKLRAAIAKAEEPA